VFYWIYDYPTWAIGVLFVAVLVAVTWIGIFVARATVHPWFHRDKHANEMVGLALSSYFVLFRAATRPPCCRDLPKFLKRRRYCRQGGLQHVRAISRQRVAVVIARPSIYSHVAPSVPRLERANERQPCVLLLECRLAVTVKDGKAAASEFRIDVAVRNPRR
jgi:hypothetical protein